jgi:TPR repeat protein
MKILKLIIISLSLVGAAYASSKDENRFQEAYTAYKSENYKKAFNIWLELAKKDIVGAQHNVADMYVAGQGVSKNNKEAVKWYKAAAENGLSRSARLLGSSYQFGYFTEINDKDSFAWYLKAAQLGDPVVQEWVGNMYEDGIGTQQSYEKALYWYMQSAYKDNIEGMWSLASILATAPDANLRNGKKAVYWAEKALKKDKFVIAEIYDVLALAYAENGNFKTAIKHQRKAIELFNEGKYLKNGLTKNHIQKYTEQLKYFEQDKPWHETSNN